MFYMPITKAKLTLVLKAEVPLESEDDQSHEDQLKKLLTHLSENPHLINQYVNTVDLSGELFQGD